jgi:hypothetical protein
MTVYMRLGEHLKDVMVLVSAWVHVKLVTVCVAKATPSLQVQYTIKTCNARVFSTK